MSEYEKFKNFYINTFEETIEIFKNKLKYEPKY